MGVDPKLIGKKAMAELFRSGEVDAIDAQWFDPRGVPADPLLKAAVKLGAQNSERLSVIRRERATPFHGDAPTGLATSRSHKGLGVLLVALELRRPPIRRARSSVA